MLINKVKFQKGDIVDSYLSIPLSISFSPEVQQYEQIENNFDLTSSDIINPIIDYEKINLSPVKTGLTESLDGLDFKLHFCNTGETSGWDTGSTLLTSIGFVEDDIANRRNRLVKTFLRLTFYDSNDLKTQNLLFYSTIFVDIDSIYSKYISNGATMSGITCEFIVENPKLSKKIKSFEGFNVYLFKDDIIKSETKTIYMRVDFNNALNGRSTLFTAGKPNISSGFTISQLYENLFFEVNCDFDETTNKYVYSFPKIQTSNYNDSYIDDNDNLIKKVLNIDLYQAKVI